MKISEQQKTIARQLGEIARITNKMRVPAQSRVLMSMLEGRLIGITPKGELSTKEIFNQFLMGWDAKNYEIKKK